MYYMAKSKSLFHSPTKAEERKMLKTTANLASLQLVLDSITRAVIIAALIVVFATLAGFVSGLVNTLQYATTYFVAAFCINMLISLTERQVARKKLEKKR